MSARRYREADVVAEFGVALAAAGLRVKGAPLMDGGWHRAGTEGDRGKTTSGRYRGYLDGQRPAGFIKNFRDDTKTGPWKFGGELPTMSDAELTSAKRKGAAEQAKRDEEKAAKAEAIAEHGTAAWEAAPPAPADHPYLLRKGISGDGLRVNAAGWLLVPMFDLGGRLRSLQRIAPDGRKLFPTGGALNGLHLLLGEVSEDGPLLIAEGYATAKTLRMATGYAVAVAFTKGNYVSIAQAYRKRRPKLPVWLCGDNDHHLPRRTPPLPNVGKEAAEAAADKVRGFAVLPEFTEDQAGSDWNDHAEIHGLEATRAAVHAALPPPPKPHYPAPSLARDEALATMDRETNGFMDSAARTSTIRREWSAIKEEIQNTHTAKTPERRQALREGRKAMARKYGKGWSAPGHRVLLPGPAGSGKTALTSSVINRVGEALGLLFFSVPSILIADAVAAQIPGAMVVRGRGQPDPDSVEQKAMCWRADTADKVARAGLPVSATLCNDGKGKVCPFFEQCGWQAAARQMREMKRGIFIGSHQYLVLPGPMPSPDIVVIDENPLGAMVGHLSFSLDRVSPDAMPGWQKAGPEKALEHREIMSKVSEALRSTVGILAGLRALGLTTAKHLAPAISYLRRVEDEDFTGDLAPDMKDGLILERLAQHERSEISSVLKMLTALASEIELPRDHAHGVFFNPNHEMMVDGRKVRQARVFVHYRKRPAFKDKSPLLVLDASGDVEVYRRLFSHRLEVVDEVRIERNAEVVQITDATFVQGTLLGADRRGNPLSDMSEKKAAQTRKQFADVANALAAKHGSLLFATNMAVETLVAPLLEENALHGHFGNMRGRNDFEHCQAALILGRMEPPASAMEDMARALHAEDPEPLLLPGEYKKTRRGIRMADGSAEMVEVNTHPDPRVQRLLELHRERESEQTADRLRLIYNVEPKFLYVACNVPLDLTVNRTVTRAELFREATGQRDNGKQGSGRRLYADRLMEAFALSGEVLPLSRVVLFELFGPDGSLFKGLWGSKRALRDDLGEVSERGRTRQIEYTIAKSALFPVRLVRYRVKGQRCPSRALVAVSDSLIRTALEALVGPVVAFEIEKPDELPLEQPSPSPPSPPEAPAAPTRPPGRAGWSRSSAYPCPGRACGGARGHG